AIGLVIFCPTSVHLDSFPVQNVLPPVRKRDERDSVPRCRVEQRFLSLAYLIVVPVRCQSLAASNAKGSEQVSGNRTSAVNQLAACYFSTAGRTWLGNCVSARARVEFLIGE